MHLSLHLLAVAIFSSLFGLFMIKKRKERINLVIGVLSSRYNFEQRQSIRDTYLKFNENDLFKTRHYFILGNEDCKIPVTYRTNSNTCSLLDFNHSINFGELIASNKQLRNSQESSKLNSGFSFSVNFNILITKIGVLSCLVDSEKNYVVQLRNALSQEIIAYAVITKHSIQTDGYLFENLNPRIQLQRNFIGIVTANVSEVSKCGNVTTPYNVDTNLITFLRVYEEHNSSFSEIFQVGTSVATSFMFTVADKQSLQGFINNYGTQVSRLESSIKTKVKFLQEENALYRDLAFVDVIEVYRSLPEKVIQFMEFAIENLDFDYFLKTDDDCFLNIPPIVSTLKENKFGDNFWWGKKYWAVDVYGKWTENDYDAPAYPPFACGSGHVLPRTLVSWIVNNKNYFHRFQGEDTSLGIWLSSLSPNYVQDERWLCTDNEQVKDILSVPQLKPNELKELYSIKLHS